MSWLTDLITPVAGSFIKDVGDTVKQFVTTDKDRMELEQKLVEVQDNFQLQIAQLNLEQTKDENAAVTQRWLSDNTAGGLPAITRPLMVWWVLGAFTIITFCDGNIGNFHINPAYIPIYQTLLITIVGGYMGLRTFEKYTGSQNDQVKIVPKDK
jgi:hypothetical protein